VAKDKNRPKLLTFGELKRFFERIDPLVNETMSSNDLDAYALLRNELGQRIAKDENVEYREDLNLPAETKLSWPARKRLRFLTSWLAVHGVSAKTLNVRIVA